MLPPNKAQSIYAQLRMLEPMLHYMRDSLASCEFDDLQLVSDFDKARLSLMNALSRMETIIAKSQEPKSVCY